MLFKPVLLSHRELAALFKKPDQQKSPLEGGLYLPMLLAPTCDPFGHRPDLAFHRAVEVQFLLA
jgi:hypothetical protein